MSITIHHNYGQVNHIENSQVVITPGKIETTASTSSDVQQDQTRTFQPRHIDKEGLADYFKASFKGIGGGTNFFAMLVKEIEKDWSEKDYCIIANMIYSSQVLNDRRPNTFKKWYELFCQKVDCPYNNRREPRHHQPTEEMKRVFSYLG